MAIRSIVSWYPGLLDKAFIPGKKFHSWVTSQKLPFYLLPLLKDSYLAILDSVREGVKSNHKILPPKNDPPWQLYFLFQNPILLNGGVCEKLKLNILKID